MFSFLQTFCRLQAEFVFKDVRAGSIDALCAKAVTAFDSTFPTATATDGAAGGLDDCTAVVVDLAHDDSLRSWVAAVASKLNEQKRSLREVQT